MTAITYDHEVIELEEGTEIELYKPIDAKVGFIKPMDVPVVFMPREDFVEAMDSVIDEQVGTLPAEVAKELRATARKMPTFPMDAWIAPGRGCGCLVGEYLIARGQLDRAAGSQAGAVVNDLTDPWRVGRYDHAAFKFDVGNALDEEYDRASSRALVEIGTGADSRVRDLLEEHGIRDDDEIQVVVIVEGSVAA